MSVNRLDVSCLRPSVNNRLECSLFRPGPENTSANNTIPCNRGANVTLVWPIGAN